MLIYALDPGPRTSGRVVYDTEAGRVHAAEAAASTADCLDGLARFLPAGTLIAIERMQSQGQSGPDLLRTCEVTGRLVQRAIDSGHTVRLVTRREVLRALDVTGIGGRDAMVRARLIEMHGGDRRTACGLKRAPGPLYGVTAHAWQALGVAVAAGLGAGEVVMP